MRVMVTGDTASESGIGELIYNLSGPTFDYFSPKSYGTGLLSIGIILMCQDPALNLKRRIRFSKKDKAFYIDIMLDLPTMLAATPAERMKEVSQRLDGEVPEYLAKYKIEDFNLTSFIADFHSWIDSLSCSSSVHLG